MDVSSSSVSSSSTMSSSAAGVASPEGASDVADGGMGAVMSAESRGGIVSMSAIAMSGGASTADSGTGEACRGDVREVGEYINDDVGVAIESDGT